MEKVTIGVIGAGNIGRLHAEHLRTRVSRANLIAVADIVLEAAQKCAEEFEIPKAIADYHEILEDDGIEAVVICSPMDTHTKIIAEAAAAKKHIFCEKPIGLDLVRIDRALKAVKKAKVKLQIGFNRRFDPNFMAVKEAIEEGKIGDPHLLHLISRDPVRPAVEHSGMFMETTIHDFDMARFLMESEVEEIYVVGGVLGESGAGDIDTALSVLRFENGAVGTIDNSVKSTYGYDQRAEVFGSSGSVRTGNMTEHRTVLSDEKGVHGPKPLFFYLDRYIEAYIGEMEAFISAILNDTETLVTGVDGRRAVLMAQAAMKSYEEQRPVKLPGVEKTLRAV